MPKVKSAVPRDTERRQLETMWHFQRNTSLR